MNFQSIYYFAKLMIYIYDVHFHEKRLKKICKLFREKIKIVVRLGYYRHNKFVEFL